MFYNIYHENSLGRKGGLTAIEEVLVKKITEAFLRGGSEVKHNGETIRFDTEYFHIYKISPSLSNKPQDLLVFFNDYKNKQYRGNFEEGVFSDLCEDVTSEFLMGYEFGELVDYYNIYLNKGDAKHYVTVLNKGEVEKFLEDWSMGANSIWVDNRLISLANPRSLKIFDIKFEFLSKHRGHIKEFQRKNISNLFDGKWSISALEYFGKDVSSNFAIRPFGSIKNVEVHTSSRIKSIEMNFHRESSNKLFISHSSKDKNLVTKFIDHVLILGLAMKRDEIFCTSLEGSNIKSGSDFRNAIKMELLRARSVIQIITKNYKASEVCLNEMGAAWILSENVIPLIALPFNYDLGFIHAGSQQLILNRKEDILKMYDDHKKDVFPENVNTSVFNKAVDDFLKFIEKAPIDEEFKRK